MFFIFCLMLITLLAIPAVNTFKEWKREGGDKKKIIDIFREYAIPIVMALIAIAVFAFAISIKIHLIRIFFGLCSMGLLAMGTKIAWGIYKCKPDPDWPGYQFSCEYGRKRPKEKEKTPVNWNSPGCLFPWLNPELQNEVNNEDDEDDEEVNKSLQERYEKLQEYMCELTQIVENNTPTMAEVFKEQTNEEIYEIYKKRFGIGGETGDVPYKEFYLDGFNGQNAEDLLEQLQQLIKDLTYMHDIAIDEMKGGWTSYGHWELPAPTTKEQIDQVAKYVKTLKALTSFINSDNESLEELYRDYIGIIRGVYGEKQIEEYLNDCKLAEWEILCGARFEAEGNKKYEGSENDFIAITPAEVVTIEVKNYASGSIVISSDGKVSRYDRYGKKVTEEDKQKMNMIEQSEYHVNQLTKLLISMGYTDIAHKVRGIIIIANNKIEVKNESKYTIIRKSLLRNELIRNSEKTLNPTEIAERLRSKQIPPRKESYEIPRLNFNGEELAKVKHLVAKINRAYKEDI